MFLEKKIGLQYFNRLKSLLNWNFYSRRFLKYIGLARISNTFFPPFNCLLTLRAIEFSTTILFRVLVWGRSNCRIEEALWSLPYFQNFRTFKKPTEWSVRGFQPLPTFHRPPSKYLLVIFSKCTYSLVIKISKQKNVTYNPFGKKTSTFFKYSFY